MGTHKQGLLLAETGLITEEQLESAPAKREVDRFAPPATAQEKAPSQISEDLMAQIPLVRMVDLLISQAVKEQASNLHLEPQQDRLRVRYRSDGVLHHMMSLPLSVHAPLISGVKILAGMDITERKRPQDGQFSFKLEEREVDLRAATCETCYGEMAVLRIRDKSLPLLKLSELGLLPEALERYEQMLKSLSGMILVAGPSGSGKTTTLHASISQLGRKICNFITMEDPIEDRFADINPIQVNPQAGITFSGSLPAVMRLDPDVILVGEIGDRDTAKIAVRAALSGHLVLSPIHVNDAVGVLFRLRHLGVEPSIISSAVVGVVAQRLVRRVCSRCRTLATASPEEQVAYEEEIGRKRRRFYYGSGCNFCAHTGYHGRTGVFEILALSEEICGMLLANRSPSEIRAQAIREGMVPMRRHGMLKANQGITTPREVVRNVFSLQGQWSQREE